MSVPKHFLSFLLLQLISSCRLCVPPPVPPPFRPPPRFPRSPSAARGTLHLCISAMRRCPRVSPSCPQHASKICPSSPAMLPVSLYLSHSCSSALPPSQRGQPQLYLCAGARSVWAQLSQELQVCWQGQQCCSDASCS